MKPTPFKFIKQNYPKIISITAFFVLLFAYARIFAIGSPYQPGVTLDPLCVPGEVNCFVETIPDQTGNSGKYLTTNGSVTSWASVVGGGGTLQSVTDSGSDTTNTVTINKNGIGQIVTDGLFLQNSTASTFLAKQYSPALHFQGQGFNVGGNVTENSDFRIYNFAGNNLGSGSGNLRIESSTAGGAYTVRFNIASDGSISTNSGSFTAGNINGGLIAASGGISVPNNNTPITIQGTAGTSGQVLTSGGAGVTPTWTTISVPSYTFSTGLTNTSGTITNNLSIGVSGGQTVIGGINASNNLTLSSTSNGTKGKIIFGSASAYDEVNNRFGIGQTSPTSKLDITSTIGSTPDNSLGIKLINGIAATSGQQQYSPAIDWKAEGWTNFSGGTSRALNFRALVTTTSNPGGSGVNGNWVLQRATNGTGSYSDIISVDHGGGTTFASSVTVGGGGTLTISGPISNASGVGTSGYVLTSQGPNQPTLWSPAPVYGIDDVLSANQLLTDDRELNANNHRLSFSNLDIFTIKGGGYSSGLLYVDTVNGITNLGDSAGDVNNTYINVDDNATTVTINAIGGVLLSNPSGLGLWDATNGAYNYYTSQDSSLVIDNTGSGGSISTIQWDATGPQTYSFPDNTGTLALTSDLSSWLTGSLAGSTGVELNGNSFFISQGNGLFSISGNDGNFSLGDQPANWGGVYISSDQASRQLVLSGDTIVYGASNTRNSNFQVFTNTSSSYMKFGKYDGDSNDDGSFVLHVTGGVGYSGAVGEISINPEEGFAISMNNGDPVSIGGSNGSLYLGAVNGTTISHNLHIGSNFITDGQNLLTLEDVNSVCNFTANSGSPTCGSDLTLKKDIYSLDTVDLLTKVSALNPVSYHWLTDSDVSPTQYGFIAQEVEAQFPNLVTENKWIDGSTKKFLNMGGLMPYVVGAVKELDIKIKGLSSFDTTDSNSIGSLIKNFLGSVSNSIDIVFFGEVHTKKLCLEDLCITKDQLQQLLNSQNTNNNPSVNPDPVIVPDPLPPQDPVVSPESDSGSGQVSTPENIPPTDNTPSENFTPDQKI